MFVSYPQPTHRTPWIAPTDFSCRSQNPTRTKKTGEKNHPTHLQSLASQVAPLPTRLVASLSPQPMSPRYGGGLKRRQRHLDLLKPGPRTARPPPLPPPAVAATTTLRPVRCTGMNPASLRWGSNPATQKNPKSWRDQRTNRRCFVVSGILIHLPFLFDIHSASESLSLMPIST